MLILFLVLALCVLVPVVFLIWAAVRGRDIDRGGPLFSEARRRTLYPAFVIALLPALSMLFASGPRDGGIGVTLLLFACFFLPSVTGLVLFGLPTTLWLARRRPPLAIAVLTVLGVAFTGGCLLLSLAFADGGLGSMLWISGMPLFGGGVALAVGVAWIAFNHRLLRDTLSSPRVPPERPVSPRSNKADG